MYIKVKDNKIEDIRWKTYGCASAIASTSALSELAKGKTLDEAVNITAKDIDDYLGNLPKHKFHCSVLGHEALKEAVDNYKKSHAQ
jgi:NifU-like protein involved in Fe-S cluster formation